MAVVSRSHAVSCQKSHVHEMALTGRYKNLPRYIFLLDQLFAVKKNTSLSTEALHNDVLCLYSLKATD